MEVHRARRVSEAVKEELAELIGFELDDPRLASVNVTTVEVSPDGRIAHVKVSIGEGSEKKVLAALEHAKSHLRHELAIRLTLRRVPDLHFTADTHPEAESRIDFLLRRAKRLKARE
jgi:ribosome-binding factor A